MTTTSRAPRRSRVRANATEQGYAFWVEHAPDSGKHPCENCNKMVPADEIRAQIPASYGRKRKKDNGTRSVWVCGRCALMVFQLDTPPEWVPLHDDQLEMFG